MLQIFSFFYFVKAKLYKKDLSTKLVNCFSPNLLLLLQIFQQLCLSKLKILARVMVHRKH